MFGKKVAEKGKEYAQKYRNEKAIDQVKFDIEHRLSADSLMSQNSVEDLQRLLNIYVHGEKKLKEDGILGEQTVKSIKQYKNESRYWVGHSVMDINPFEVAKGYPMEMEAEPAKGRGKPSGKPMKYKEGK